MKAYNKIVFLTDIVNRKYWLIIALLK